MKTNINKNIADFNQMKQQQELLFFQNAAIFSNSQNLMNLQNYNLSQFQFMDTNQMMQFYRLIHAPNYCANLLNQAASTTNEEEIENGYNHGETKRTKLNFKTPNIY